MRELFEQNGVRIILEAKFTNKDGEKEISVSDVYDSLSVNGFMMDYTMYGVYADVGRSALLDMEIQEDGLEEYDIANVSDITEASILLEIEDENYNTIAEPKVKIEFGQ